MRQHACITLETAGFRVFPKLNPATPSQRLASACGAPMTRTSCGTADSQLGLVLSLLVRQSNVWVSCTCFHQPLDPQILSCKGGLFAVSGHVVRKALKLRTPGYWELPPATVAKAAAAPVSDDPTPVSTLSTSDARQGEQKEHW